MQLKTKETNGRTIPLEEAGEFLDEMMARKNGCIKVTEILRNPASQNNGSVKLGEWDCRDVGLSVRKDGSAEIVYVTEFAAIVNQLNRAVTTVYLEARCDRVNGSEMQLVLSSPDEEVTGMILERRIAGSSREKR